MENKLTYNKSADSWEEALPLGNGALGAMVYGGSELEFIQINSDTLWSGTPQKEKIEDKTEYLKQIRRAVFNQNYALADETADKHFIGSRSAMYMPLGDLYMKFFEHGAVSDYYRELCLDKAEVNIHYRKNALIYKEGKSGTVYSRKIYISKSYNTMIIELTSDCNDISFSYFAKSDLKHTAYSDKENLYIEGNAPSDASWFVKDGNPLSYSSGDTIGFMMCIGVIAEGGKVEVSGNSAAVYHAKRAAVILSAETNYAGYASSPDKNKPMKAILEARIAKVKNDGIDNVYSEHIRHYEKFYNRVSLTVDSENSENSERLCTDERIRRIRDGQDDKSLPVLMFNFARYLMIAGSGKGSQPLNLQGIWNNRIQPEWASNYTVNINTEMNYWPVHACNLAECDEPMLAMIEELSEAGKTTAKMLYGCRGFAVHHNVDIWRKTTPSEGCCRWATWPLGGCWLAINMWEHYEYTLDSEFLKNRAYPVLKGCAEFIADFLTEYDGYFVICPSISPENAFFYEGKECHIAHSSTMDVSIVREILTDFIKASEIAEKTELVAESKNILSHLYPIRIASDGRLQEWCSEFEETEPGHRHFSHLFGLCPGSSISNGDNDFIEGCRKSLLFRIANGSGKSGWSCAWIINLFSRLHDGDNAYKYIVNQLDYSTYFNLFDAHPPFQIDGNFGLAFGICQMIVQSELKHNTVVISLLPAMPKAWKKGEVHGIRVKGNIELDIIWNTLDITFVKVNNFGGLKYKIISEYCFKETDKS